jgi:hypothetical protein
LDIVAFEELEARGDAASLAAAVELYRGELLEGLSLDGCAEFEIWLVGERERWRQRVARVLGNWSRTTSGGASTNRACASPGVCWRWSPGGRRRTAK